MSRENKYSNQQHDMKIPGIIFVQKPASQTGGCNLTTSSKGQHRDKPWGWQTKYHTITLSKCALYIACSVPKKLITM